MSDATKSRRLLLVGWDAADWKVISPLVDNGMMPHLAGMLERGVMGNLATMEPVLSPMLWTSIATGKRPYKHGIHGFSEPDPQNATVRPITNLSRTTKALWNILNQEGKTSLVVGWWPSNPAEPIRGAMVSDRYQQAVAPLGKPWPMPPGTVHPPELGGELAGLRVHPHELEGDLLRLFVPQAAEIDQEKDKRLESLAKIIAECANVQAAATYLMEQTPDWDLAAVYFDGIDHFGHGFMKYHPPRLDWIDERDYALYRNVVNSGYLFHDMMLGRLLELAGAEATVMLVSDHGFHPDHLRPKQLPNEPAGPAAEHRPFGVFAACGPGIKQDALVYGATLLDVTPTALSLFGLPIGRDMDGRVLADIYQAPPSLEYLDTWDAIPGDDGRHAPETQLDSVDAQEAIRQLVDLGYIDEPDTDLSKAVDETIRELRYNLARAYADGSRFDEAAALFDELWEQWPSESRFGVHRLRCELQRGDAEASRSVLERLKLAKAAAAEKAASEIAELMETLREQHPVPDDQDSGEAEGEGIDWEQVEERDQRRLKRLRGRAMVNKHAFVYFEGSVLHLEGLYQEALETLAAAVTAQTTNLPSLYLKMGEVCTAKRDWQQAMQHYRKVVELDDLHTAAHYGLARVAFRLGDWERAANEALTAAGQRYRFPQAHYLAGMARWRQGRLDDALRSLQNAIAINPVYPAAQRALGRFFLQARMDPGAHLRHLKLAREAHRRIAENQALGMPGGRHPQEHRDAFTAEASPGDTAELGPPPSLPPLAESVVVVTGLPRAGTSMMMQMLDAGGVPVLTDEHRPADASNERGYFEHQNATRLAKDGAWIGDANGRAVKIVAQLMPHLPQSHAYRVIMMHRPLDEVVASQRKMLTRLGKEGGRMTDDALSSAYMRQVAQVRTLLLHLRKRGVLDVLDVRYHDALADPQGVARRIADFVGGSFDADRAARTIDPSLRHEGV